jgi:hypothetical protein
MQNVEVQGIIYIHVLLHDSSKTLLNCYLDSFGVIILSLILKQFVGTHCYSCHSHLLGVALGC